MIELNTEEILQSSAIFSGLSKDKTKKLSMLMTEVSVPGGNILFEKGSESDALYIIARGLLIALDTTSDGNEKLFGTLHVGEVVGEIGLISSFPRSLTVRAIHDSVLMKLTRESFNRFFENEPRILTKITNLIIYRSHQNSRTPHHGFYNYSNVILVPSGDFSNMNFFVNKFSESLENFSTSKFFYASDMIKNPEKTRTDIFSDRTGKDGLNFLVADKYDEEVFDFFLSHSDRIMVIAEAGGRLPPEIAKKIKHAISNGLRADLVILHRSDIISDADKWKEQYDFFRINHIRKNYESTDFISLARFLAGRPTGLVLGGGGARGWFEVGVIKAIMEKKIQIDYVCGVSIGSIVGACFLTAENYSEFFEKFSDIIRMIGNPFGFSNFTFPVVSILSGKRGTEALFKYFGNMLIENMKRPYLCVSSNISTSAPMVHSQGILGKWLRASSSVPGLLPPVADHGFIYVDGGVVNNLPVDVMKYYMEDRGRIIAVDLTSVMSSDIYYDFPPIMTFFETICLKLKIGKYSKYKFPSYYSTLLRSLLVGSMEKIRQNAKMADCLIQPNLTSYRALSHSKSKEMEELILLGYETSVEKFDQISF